MGFKTAIFFLVVVASTAINALGAVDIDASCTNGFPNYRFYPYDCRKYLGCLSGETKIYSCPTSLYWNEEIKACDVEEKTDCSHIIPYPVPDCLNATERYYDYPYDCAKFYECFGKKAYLLNCPSNSLWNDKIKECDDHDKVDCSRVIPFPPTTTTTAKPTTPKPTTPKPTTPKPTTPKPTTPKPTHAPYTTPKIECTTKREYYPYPYDCQKYYECSNGKAVLMSCPGVLDWNDKIKTCDQPENVDCSCKIAIFFLVVVASTAINALGGLNIDPECVNGFPNYRFYPYDCRKFLGCLSGETKIYSCPTGLYWNEEIKACDVEEKTDCSHIIPYPVPDCRTATERYYYYPYDCAKFWECYENKAYLLNCPADSLWNDGIKECDDHDKVDCCNWDNSIPTNTYVSKTYHSKTNHSKTYHSETYHSKTNHSKTYHSKTNHSKTYHSETYHSKTYHSETYHSKTNHSKTYHSETYHSETYHSKTYPPTLYHTENRMHYGKGILSISIRLSEVILYQLDLDKVYL
ncbi:unnamed protein product [Phyllotreta striolata]|uniref:Chitin-binding type-2 domain-containing protein n=1 Tax=Phyllotreta striolata TaxID=444603 RepID=A0A9N9XSI0_PHYSR|nr:unnamed protein product [Phyllotreta striolata]